MKSKIAIRVLSLLLAFCSSLFGQTDFWAHHSLNFRINGLHKSVSGTFYAASDTSILKSSDYGLTWEVIYTTPHPCTGWTRLDLYSNKNYLLLDKLIVQQQGCLNTPPPILSLDGGNTWVEFILPPGIMRDAAINSFGEIYVVTDTNLYLTTNDGNNWQTVNVPILEEDEHFRKLEVDTLNTLYISKDGSVFVPPYYLHYENIYRSTNYGQDWNFILTTGGGPGFVYSSMFTISKGDLFASVDGTLETQHYFDGNVKVYSLIGVKSAFITSIGDIFLASNPWGIKVSYNNGITWVPENSGLTSLHTSSILSDSLEYLYTSTGTGIFKSIEPIYPTVVSNEIKVCSFNLSQNYPNPFNPATTISYQIPERGYVTIKVYDVLGNKVAMLVNEEKPAGSYEVEFDGSNLSSGIYFYRMRAGNFIDTKKLILLK